MSGKTIVLHSGMQHAEHVAIAYKLADDLAMLASGTFFQFSSRVLDILRPFPALHRMYLNRSSQKLNSQDILSVSRFELAERILQHMAQTYAQRREITHWRDRAMSRYIANRWPANVGKLYSFPNVAYDAFNVAQNHGVKLLLDLPIGHFQLAMQIAEEERRDWPELSSTFTFDAPPLHFERRFNKELDLADVLVCGSKFVRDSFISNGISPDKLKIVKYGSSLPVISAEEAEIRMQRVSDSASTPLHVTYVGQFSQRKGLSYLIEAIRAAKRRANIRFTMIGSFIGSSSWIDANHDVIDRLVIKASRERLRKELLASDVFFFPSLFEGSALVIHEAAALGLPVVTTENAGADFILEKGIGEVHAIRDVDSYVDALVRFADDRSYLTQITERAISHAPTSTWESFYNMVPHL